MYQYQQLEKETNTIPLDKDQFTEENWATVEAFICANQEVSYFQSNEEIMETVTYAAKCRANKNSPSDTIIFNFVFQGSG